MFTKHYLQHPSLNAEFQQWYESRFWPVIGREDDDEGSKDDDDTDANADEEDDSAADADTDDDDDDDKGKKADGDAVTKLTADLAKAKAEITAAQQAVRKAKQEAREARNRAATDSGDWEKVAKEREAELADATERATKAEESATKTTGELDEFQREVRVTRIASKLSFRDPADAIALLSRDDTGDDKATERALRKLADDKDYLVDQRKATGRAFGAGGGNNGLFTKEQLAAMSTDEINQNWDKVQASTAALNETRG